VSKLEVDKITPQSGTTLTIGEAGDTTVVNGLGTLPATIGSAAQVLSVNAGATGLVYGTAVTDLSNLNATNLTSGTVPDGRFPSVLPAAGGQNLTSLNPAAMTGGTFPAINAQNLTNIPGEISWQSTIVTTSSTIVASRGYWINTTSNAVTITLPGSASVGDRIILTDYLRTWGSNALTINQNSLKFQGNTSPNPVYDTAGQSVDLVYSGATQGWIPNSDDDVTLETAQTYSANFLVIAGGGSGGIGTSAGNSEGGGGGGAGGYRTSAQTISPGNAITITVGDGGASVSASDTNGNKGSSSSISGTGLTTITSDGGGFGASPVANGGSGGSGGGGGTSASPGAGGNGNTPSTSPSQGNNGGSGGTGAKAGGGGGAGAVGTAGSSSQLGNGGNGLASSITGSSVTRAGGGGAGIANSPAATGGSGGGGAGGHDSPGLNGTAGTANTGSGGGGMGTGSSSRPTGAGGKGVVIISVPTANYSSTTTGSPTVTTSGGNTIMQFNGSGSYTS